MHCPEPMSPLDWWIWSTAMIPGFNEGLVLYDVPLRFDCRRINTHYYYSVQPLPLPPDEMAAAVERSRQKHEAAMGRLDALWSEEWLPRVQRHLLFWEAFALPGATPAAFLEHFDESVRRIRDAWKVHFEQTTPTYLAISLFDELHHDLFGGGDAFDSHRMLQGLPNKTVESGQELWRLSREALAQPAVRAAIADEPAEQVVAALEATAEGRAFLTGFRAYLEVYGHRGHNWDLVSPRWTEDPTPAVRALQEYVRQPERDLAAEAEAMAAQRERRIASARQRLAGYPRAAVERFDFLLKAAQTAVVLTEDHGFWIDFRATSAFRAVLLEAGRRLAEVGAIGAASDVFYLSPDEIRRELVGESAGDLRRAVAERSAEMERFRAVVPPPELGTRPAGPPPDDPIIRSLVKFGGAPPPASTDPGVVRGHAGSPGQVRGVARVIRSLAEAGRLGRGEVLVAPTTAPPWTPLFATAAAVVTDAGGILSHCAVVAREYGIPAVVGTGRATELIADGALVEVDGDAGIVRIVR